MDKQTSMQVIIPIEVFPFVRMTRRSKWVDLDAQKYLSWKEKFASLLMKEVSLQNIQEQECLLKFSSVFFVHQKRYKKGDLDNMIKSVLDGCQKILFKNDSQVKEYGECKIELIPDDLPCQIFMIIEKIEEQHICECKRARAIIQSKTRRGRDVWLCMECSLKQEGKR